MTKDKMFYLAMTAALAVDVAVFAGCAFLIKWVFGLFDKNISFWSACGIWLALHLLAGLFKKATK